MFVDTWSSEKGTPLCMLIFFNKSPPSQNSITINKLPFSAQKHNETDRNSSGSFQMWTWVQTHLEMMWWKKRCLDDSFLTAASPLSKRLPFLSLTSEWQTHSFCINWVTTTLNFFCNALYSTLFRDVFPAFRIKHSFSIVFFLVAFDNIN